MTTAITNLIQKDSQKGIIPNNYRPKLSVLLVWKIQSALICEEKYNSLVCSELFPEGEKECHKETVGTDDLLYFDRYMLKECNMWLENVGMAWVDHKKASLRKINKNAHGRYEAICKREKELDIHTKKKNILPGYRNAVWHRKICRSHNKKWKNRNNWRKSTTK